MINTKQDYIFYATNDLKRYKGILNKKSRFRHDFYFLVVKYLKNLRKCEYYYNSGKMIRYFLSSNKKNRLSLKLQSFIPINTTGYGLMLYHGNIVINSMSHVGNNCSFHGNNCIGNKGRKDLLCPSIGDNVDVGFGSIIIGGITIPNGCEIGANSLVNKDFDKTDLTLIGSPAKILR